MQNQASSSDPRAPTREGALAAGRSLSQITPATPLLPYSGPTGRFWLKAECLQLTGSFKLRGAWHRLTSLAPKSRSRGVVAFSSGNHAQGVAWAARALNMPAAIVMPADAPRAKLEGTAALGAEIIRYDRATESREQIAAALAAERGATLVPSFDDPWIVEGQGSAGVEIAEQLGRVPKRVVVCCGGGGLSAGIALALPGAEIVVAEPEGWDDMGESLRRGEIVPVGPNPPTTACDALQTLRVSPITFAVLRAAGARGLAVSEAEVAEAQRAAFRRRLVVEPGGAVALAAVLAGKVEADEDTVVVLSGGNVDPGAYARVISS